MFKLFKKQKNKLTSTKKKNQQKNYQKKDDECPMCHVSDEVINNLKGGKEERIQNKNHKSCCG